MLPAPRSSLPAPLPRLCPLRLTTLAAVLVVLGESGPALAQVADHPHLSEQAAPADPGAVAPAPADTAPAGTAPAPEQSAPISFEADQVEYLSDSETVVASGNVVLRRDEQSVRAGKVSWNRQTGKIVASGGVHMIDKDGNELFSDQVELTDAFETGAMENLLMVMRQGGRIAANSGKRQANGEILLAQAAYTACEVEDRTGCPKEPTWKITARQVVYDPNTALVRFSGAHLVFFGAARLPLPGLKIATDGRAITGFLIPDFRFSASNGVEVNESYTTHFGKNRDLTATAYLYTDVPPMAELQYRQLTDKGAFQITGYATDSRRIPVGSTSAASTRDLRGYIFANGRFQLSPEWSITASIRRASDRTFLRRYDISRDDRLRSMVDVERIGPRSYFSIAGWATQTMRVGDSQGQVPVALPEIDYRLRLADPVVGGKVEIQANSLAITRTSGQDTQRAFVSAQWSLSRLTRLGQEVTLTALTRGDLYHSDQNYLTSTALYRGNPGWQARAIAIAAVDVRWPLVGSFLGGSQVLTPRVQLVASPPIRNLAVPNEDARAIDLEDSNLFALNRFPGYDRVEDGVRFTYGFDWQFDRPRWRIKTTIGQSVRLTSEPTLFPNGTGLTGRVSDIVGRTEIQYRDLVKFEHRFRVDKDNFAVRRNEFDATLGNHATYLEIGYLRLNRDITSGIEDLQDREELRSAGRIAFARYWSLFGSAVVNLTNKAEDPTLGSNGFQPLRTRLGLAYQDDCLEVALTWRRDYITTGDAKRGNSFQIHFAFRNLGVR